jgi:hypothetical protein
LKKNEVNKSDSKVDFHLEKLANPLSICDTFTTYGLIEGFVNRRYDNRSTNLRFDLSMSRFVDRSHREESVDRLAEKPQSGIS